MAITFKKITINPTSSYIWTFKISYFTIAFKSINNNHTKLPCKLRPVLPNGHLIVHEKNQIHFHIL